MPRSASRASPSQTPRCKPRSRARAHRRDLAARAGNDWGLGPRLVAQGNDYIAELALPAGVHSFKLASEDWSTIDLGAPGPGPGATLPLAFRGSNITLTIAEAGTYRFKVTKTAEGAVLGVEVVRCGQKRPSAFVAG